MVSLERKRECVNIIELERETGLGGFVKCALCVVEIGTMNGDELIMTVAI